ncbi:hypothetical protein Tco_0231875 [Tanacetum coccineum]
MSIYLKHMGGYKHNQLKGRSYDEIQKLFGKEMKRVNSFVATNLEAQEISRKKDESSSKKAEITQDSSAKRAGDKLKSDKSKKQKTDEIEEVEVDNEAELKMHMVIVKDDDIAIDAIPLATKPPMIVEYKLIKEGIMGHYQLIRADGSSKKYSSMIRMLQGIDREDLQTLWKLVKTKHGDIRPEDEHERVLWGDLKAMFEPNIKSDVWRNLQGYKVTVWKLFDSCGVHFIRFGNVHIFMLVEKTYPLTLITITIMLNKKLQADYWNEMCYQLLKLMIHMMNIKFRGGLLGLKDFKMILRVTTAQVKHIEYLILNASPLKYCLRVFSCVLVMNRGMLCILLKTEYNTVRYLLNTVGKKIKYCQAKDSTAGCHKSQESKTSRHVKRGRDTKIPQSSGPSVKVGDEAVHKELGDRMERAATTV